MPYKKRINSFVNTLKDSLVFDKTLKGIWIYNAGSPAFM